MLKKLFIIGCFIAWSAVARSQNNPPDSTQQLSAITDIDIDSMDIDDLLNDLDLFLDSILTPRSYVLLNVSASQGYFTFSNKNNTKVSQVRKIIWSPTFGYYDKN